MTHTITLVKYCSKCGILQSVNNFYKDHNRKDGYDPRCKACEKIRGKARHNKKQHNKQAKEYRKTIRGCLVYRFGNIKQRCTNPKNKDYKRYGARGIEVKFKNADEFIDYVMNNLQVDPHGLQIDRINNDGHYEKGNIRLTTAKENCNNRRKRKCVN